ncbi:hypothetical protein JW968_07155 [Candidatus Woesearchaeota archaeon]|nr:hypothetical protein [Candidatus Woesearchaeota archaeon]
MKRGQVTVFIVLGIVILMIVSLVIYMTALRHKGEIEMTVEQARVTDFEQIRMLTQKCVEDVAETQFFSMGLKGGYYTLPPLHFKSIYSDIPYFYFEGYVGLVNKTDLERELSEAIEEAFPYCLQGFRNYKMMGYSFNEPNVTADVEVGIKNIIFKIRYPLEIKKGDAVKSYEEFEYVQQARMLNIIDAAKEIVLEVIKDPRYTPTSTILEMSAKHDLQIDTLSYGTIVTYVVQDKSLLSDGGVPYMFLFSTKTSPMNNPPTLPIEDMEAKVNETFYYEIESFDADYDSFEFFSDNPALPVGRYSGFINFTPTVTGVYDVNLSVVDELNATNWKMIKFTVTR